MLCLIPPTSYPVPQSNGLIHRLAALLEFGLGCTVLYLHMHATSGCWKMTLIIQGHLVTVCSPGIGYEYTSHCFLFYVMTFVLASQQRCCHLYNDQERINLRPIICIRSEYRTTPECPHNDIPRCFKPLSIPPQQAHSTSTEEISKSLGNNSSS